MLKNLRLKEINKEYEARLEENKIRRQEAKDRAKQKK